MVNLGRSVRVVIAALLVGGFAGSAAAQDNFDQGKTGAQLYASNCASCHKSPQGLTKAGGIGGLTSFLSEHYTASRKSAAVIADYLKTVDRAPAAPTRGVRRAARTDDTPAGQPPAKRKAKAKPAASQSTEAKPAAAKPDEPKAAEPKADEAKPSESKPADGDK
jgi:hypothetical protein